MKIDKQIPVANHTNRKYDFGKMEVGDSHLLDTAKKRYAIFSAVRWYNEKNGTNIKISTRKDGISVRFWRIG
jgi:molybdate-binding protein